MQNLVSIHFTTDNAAFTDEGYNEECARILEEAAAKFRQGVCDFSIIDTNGNKVGICSTFKE